MGIAADLLEEAEKLGLWDEEWLQLLPDLPEVAPSIQAVIALTLCIASYYLLVVRYSVSGKARAAFDEARTSGGSYSKAAELYSAAAWSMEALCHLHGGDHVLAEAAAKRSTEGDPVAWYGWEHRGTALALLGRNVEAITSFSQALRLKDVPEEARTGMKQTIAALRGVIAGKGAFKNAKKA